MTLLSQQIDVHNMKLNSSPFEMIKRGEKTIELRLFDEKRQQVKIGDKIVFTNTANGEVLNTTVVKLHRFDSFEELYKSLPLLKCGYNRENIDRATPSDMEQYYSVEEQRKYGVVGIELYRTENITDASQVNDKKTRWSYSRATCFGNCKYEFYLDYIINDDNQYLSEGNFYAEVGSYVHEILSMIFKGELQVEDALQYYIDNYDNYVCYKVKKSTMEKSYETIADYFASLDIEWLKDYEILGVELEQRFTIDGYDFIGFIDLLLRDKRDGKIVVLDHKSSEYPFKKNGEVKKKSQQSFESYKRQMYLYCHAIHQTYNEFPKEITWNHFKDGGAFATIPFVKSEYDETIKWFKDTIKTIEREEEFEPSEDYFYCFNLCNFRNSCEYKKAASKG